VVAFVLRAVARKHSGSIIALPTHGRAYYWEERS
jgi:hypothetical protein